LDVPSRPDVLGQALPILEFLAPEVQAVYLRPGSPPRLPSQKTSEESVGLPQTTEETSVLPTAKEGPAPLSMGSNDTLADLITRTVSGLLEKSLHESVIAAVRALAPRMIITFPPPHAVHEESSAAPLAQEEVASAPAVEPVAGAPAPAAVDVAVADAAADEQDGTAAT
jgi:hypothetical protein